LREMAVLMVVLYPLEAGVSGKFNWSDFTLVEVGAGILLYLGIILEGRDEL